MSIGRDMLGQLEHAMRPIATRIANSIARGVVNLIDDSRALQVLQIGAIEGEEIDDAEHHQPYGLSSVPHPGAEFVAVFPGGDRSHPLVIAVSDRRHRPTDGEPGTVTLYSSGGATVTLLPDGAIEIQPGPGAEVRIASEGGTPERLVRASEFAGHTHPAGTLAAPNGAVTGVSGGAAAVAGTQALRAE